MSRPAIWTVTPTLLVACALGMALSAENPAEDQVVSYSGTVVDWDSRKPLGRVWAIAYKTNIVEKVDDCPVYKEKLAGDESDKNGDFSLEVPTELSDYYVQYCLNGYGGLRTHNKNKPNGFRVKPDPVKLCKSGESSEAVQQKRISEVIDDVSKGRIDPHTARQELAYLRDVDTEGYDAALAKNNALLARVKTSRGPYPFVLAHEKRPRGWRGWVGDLVVGFIDWFRQD